MVACLVVARWTEQSDVNCHLIFNVSDIITLVFHMFDAADVIHAIGSSLRAFCLEIASICFTRRPHCNLPARVIGVHTSCKRALHARRTKIPRLLVPHTLGLLVHEDWKQMATDIMSLEHLTDNSKPNA